MVKLLWWWCRMDPPHMKMLSDRQPICKLCNVPMSEGTMLEPPKQEQRGRLGT